ncbi:ATP-grasp domain-containing protein [Catellatospora bangladeshensis]|uniref:ATP-grasp domain-containing protein n=1 Tax=Catellatospora bangladeshensis TaxID=310355 RepID=A0A8J3JNT7_9ACTN|nr:ATP-grasp domain-containing protein [Catellatospora bangladeshensis]GIF84097.1 hypothetical protein Cba03nite_54460 [Catellatospora bangladeshensis]
MERVLILPPRVTETGLAYADAARRRGMRVETVHGWRLPEHLVGHPGAHLYAGPLFADAVGAELGIGLLEPDPDWLARLPWELTRRVVVFTTLARARELDRPAFVKPPDDKSFPARVYPSGAALPGLDVLDGDTPVLVSDVVEFQAEFRCFVAAGEVRAVSRYAVGGELDVAPAGADPRSADAAAFAGLAFASGLAVARPACLGTTAAAATAGGPDGAGGPGGANGRGAVNGGERLGDVGRSGLPSAVVVDVGLIADPGSGRPEWAVIEANAAWASGHYAADADAALDVALRSAMPRAEIAPADVPYLRNLPTVVR